MSSRASRRCRAEGATAEIPEEWLRKLAEKLLTDEEKAQIEAMGGWEKLMETLKKRLEEQQKRHQGGSKWIGTAGTSPFGAYGFNPEGVRIGQDKNREGRAVKVWDKREYKNLDDTVEIGTRNIKIALRRLRKFAREGAEVELDMPDTIRSTARNAGYLDIKMVPERRNKVKLLLLFDIGGSMDAHIRVCEELFSAARTEFKHLEFFYFHNCLYEKLWKDNRRRHVDTFSTAELLHTYPPDYKVIFVGDASMSPYEIAYPGGSVEHWNEEAGQVWIQRMVDTYRSDGVAEPGARAALELHAVDPAAAAAFQQPHVPADAGRPRQRDEGTEQIRSAVAAPALRAASVRMRRPSEVRAPG